MNNSSQVATSNVFAGYIFKGGTVSSIQFMKQPTFVSLSLYNHLPFRGYETF